MVKETQQQKQGHSGSHGGGVQKTDAVGRGPDSSIKDSDTDSDTDEHAVGDSYIIPIFDQDFTPEGFWGGFGGRGNR